MLSLLTAPQDPFGQLPPPASSFAGEVDSLFYFLFWICAFFFTLILGVLIYSSIRFRRKTPDQPAASDNAHNTPLEVVWTLIPTVIVMMVFAWGFSTAKDEFVAPADALSYQCIGKKWEWVFVHPDSQKKVAREVYVPVDTPVKFVLTSEDVLHSFFVPAFRVKRDAVPGVKQVVWFKATTEGEYPLYCAEYCGENHSQMLATVKVVSKARFETKPWGEVPTEPMERAQYFYDINCASCHSTNGSVVVGPSFQGIWGRKGQLETGDAYQVDEAYIRESIREPQAKIVKGYPTPMTAFSEADLSDEDIGHIIEWMKTLN